MKALFNFPKPLPVALAVWSPVPTVYDEARERALQDPVSQGFRMPPRTRQDEVQHFVFHGLLLFQIFRVSDPAFLIYLDDISACFDAYFFPDCFAILRALGRILHGLSVFNLP